MIIGLIFGRYTLHSLSTPAKVVLAPVASTVPGAEREPSVPLRTKLASFYAQSKHDLLVKVPSATAWTGVEVSSVEAVFTVREKLVPYRSMRKENATYQSHRP